MAESWQGTNDGQQANRGYNNGNPTFGSRNFNNSNYRGPRRDNNGMNKGGFQGEGPRNNGGAYGNNQRGFGQQNGNGRQQYDRQPRMNFNGGAPRTYNFDSATASSIGFDIASDKVGMVIGRGGGQIRQIQDSFKVHVKIDRDQGLNGLTGVTIRGEEGSIEQAKHYIQQLIAVK